MAIENKISVRNVLVTAAAFVIFVAGVKAATSIIIPLLLAVFLAIITTPMFIGLQKHHIPAPLALLILVIGLLVVSGLLVVVITNSANNFAQNLDEYQTKLQAQVNGMTTWLAGRGIDVPDQILKGYLNTNTILRALGTSVSAISGILGQAFLILLITIFILFEAAILPAKVKAMPGMTKDGLKRLEQIVESFRHYMGLKTVISLFTGILVAILMALLGIDYPVLLGLLAFFLNYVPNIGSIMASIPGIMLALIQFGVGRALIVAGIYIAINVIIGNVIEPRVMGKGLGLSPMIVMVSLVLWGWVLGPVGMLLSVPLTMTLKIILENIESTKGIAILLGSNVPKSEAVVLD